MASYYAVAIAAFMQIIVRISFFIEQNSDMCSTAPTLASWIFLLAFLDVLLDICIYPVRYMHLPYVCQLIVETVATVFLAEIGSLLVWCKIEKIICKLSKTLLLLIGMSPAQYYKWENYILGTATTLTSLAILWLVVQATDHVHFMHKRSLRICRKINSKFMETWRKLRSRTMVTNNNCVDDLAQQYCCHADHLNLTTEETSYEPRSNTNNSRKRSRARTARSRNRNRRYD